MSDGELGGQDLAFLAWESRRYPMHIAARIDFAGPECAPTLEALRGLLAPRVAEAPRLGHRLVRRGLLRRPAWQPDAVEIAWHVRELESRAAGARDAIDAVLRQPLDRSRPLWELWLARDAVEPRAFSLLVKIHHALVDGASGVALLEQLLGTGAQPVHPAPASSGAALPGPAAVPALPFSRRASWLQMLRFARAHWRRSPPSLLHGDVAARRHHLLEVDATAFETAAAALRGSVNDLVLACVSGALRRWLVDEMGNAAPRSLHAFCPVNLRRPGETTPGNRIAPWFVPLPLDEPELAARVARIADCTRALRQRGDQLGGDGFARWIRRLGGFVAKAGSALAAWRRSYSIVVTNVPPARRPLALDAARSTQLGVFPPLLRGQRVAISYVRHGLRAHLGVTEALPDAASGQRLVDSLARELSSAAPRAPRRETTHCAA